jgi:phytoene/squalene synthetase
MTNPFEDPDLVACAGLVERGDPDRFAAIMAAPVLARARLFPLYALNVEVSRAPWVTEEPVIAEMRLQWWRDVLDEIAGGGPVRRHEVATPLAGVLDKGGAEALSALVEARRWDIYRDPHEDAVAVEVYLDQTAGLLMETAARVLGATDASAARSLGWASGLVAYLQAVPELEARGRIPLVDGRPEAVAALARQGLARLSEARSHAPSMPRAARPALLSGWMAAPLLRLAVAEPSRVADGTLQLSEGGRRWRRLWVGITGRF